MEYEGRLPCSLERDTGHISSQINPLYTSFKDIF
jgi:hypothetical protein